MYRIKNPEVSLDFYTRVMGMTLLKRFHFDEAKFSLYFMGYENPSDIPQDDKERTHWALSRKATLELTQYDPLFLSFHNILLVIKIFFLVIGVLNQILTSIIITETPIRVDSVYTNDIIAIVHGTFVFIIF